MNSSTVEGHLIIGIYLDKYQNVSIRSVFEAPSRNFNSRRLKISKGEDMKSKYVGRFAAVAVSAFVAIAMAAPLAQAATPAPGYTQFAGCPSKAEKPAVSTCIRSVVKSGNFKMGNKNVTIEKPIVLSGGTDEFLGNFTYNSKGGMPPVNQKVPGGVIGLTGLTWLLEFFGSEALTLYAATELAGTPVFHGFEQIELPIKVHLIHSVLGNNCYVGSTLNPIKLENESQQCSRIRCRWRNPAHQQWPIR